MRTGKFFMPLLALMLIVFLPQSSRADDYGPQSRRVGVGIIAGDPTGVTVKGYVAPRTAINGIASWSFIDDAFTLIGDVTYDLLEIDTRSQPLSLPFYVGAGGKFVANNKNTPGSDSSFGVRVPVGVAAQFEKIPLEISVEVGPGIELVPETEFDITGGIAARFYF